MVVFIVVCVCLSVCLIVCLDYTEVMKHKIKKVDRDKAIKASKPVSAADVDDEYLKASRAGLGGYKD